MLADTGVHWTSAVLKSIFFTIDDSGLTPLLSKIKLTAGTGAVSVYCDFSFFIQTTERKSSTLAKLLNYYCEKPPFCSCGPSESEDIRKKKQQTNKQKKL